MKVFKRKVIKGTNWALAGLMSLLGLSCSKLGFPDSPVVCEYGTPHAEYQVHGVVKDEQGNVLQGIRITVPEIVKKQANNANVTYDWNEQRVPVGDTIYTDGQGRYDYSQTYFPVDALQVNLKVEDPEGRFESQTDSVKFEAKDLKGGSGWFQGKAEKVKDFFLKGRN